MPWVGFLAQPSFARAPARAQLRTHTRKGVDPELRAGGGGSGRLHQKPYPGQRKVSEVRFRKRLW